QEELKALQKTLGITFIFVTHDQGEALSMANRVAVFNEGKVMQVGSPEDIYRSPNSRFVADFVGSSNVLAPVFVGMMLGEKRWASLRPESIHVIKAGGDSVSRLTGTVLTRSYQGATTRLGIDLNGTDIVAVVPAPDDVPDVGDRVTVASATE